MSTPNTVNILFDETHKERGRITLNFKTLKKNLEENSCIVHRLGEGPITTEHLANAAALVLACPSASTFTQEEIGVIVEYVHRGGGLVMMSSSGGDKTLQTNLNDISTKFGFILNDDIVSDESNNVKYNTVPIITEFPSSPFTANLSELHFPDTCSIEIEGESDAIINTSRLAKPPETPLVVTSAFGEGRVVLFGSHKMFQDRVLGGIESANNSLFATRIFRWVVGAEKTSPAASQTQSIKPEQAPPTEDTSPPPEAPPPKPEPPIEASRGEVPPSKADVLETGVTQEIIEELSIKVEDISEDVKKSISSITKNIEEITRRMSDLEKRMTQYTAMVAQPVEASDDEALGTASDIAGAIQTAKAERASLMELLEYITQRHQAGGLPKAEFNEQQEHLNKEIKRIDRKIAKLENR